MESQTKKQVNRFLAFFMAVAMVLTSITVTPLTANAEEGNGQESSVSDSSASGNGTTSGNEGDVSGNDPSVSEPTIPEPTVSGTNLTVHFKNEKNWEKVYAKFGSGSAWSPISGLEYCKETEYGGVISPNASNPGWYSFKIVSEAAVSEVNGLFNTGAWGTGNQTANFAIVVEEHSEAWITYQDADNSDDVEVSYEKPAGWVDGAEVEVPSEPPVEEDPTVSDNGISNPDDTVLKLYYYITDETKSFGDYAVNAWEPSDVSLTEAGPYLNITAWKGEKYRTLLDAELENTIDGLDGKWGYVGLDSNNITGMQFLTVDGGDNVWNKTIKDLNLDAAYYVDGYGWFKDAALEEEIKPLELQTDELYIVGSTEFLGNWTLNDAIKMDKTGEDQYEVTISLSANTYEYTPVQDPVQFGWEHQYKDYENVKPDGSWPNYTITVEEDSDIVFTVKNPDPSTGKAEVTAKVKEEPVVETKTFTVTFKDGDKVLKTETVESGKAATAPALPTKTGYTASWDKAFANVTADITVNVKWTANTYTLTYDVNGGTKLATSTKTVTYDGTYGTLPNPVRKGYTFKGWFTAKTAGTKVTEATKVTGNATIYAQWTKVTKPGKVTVKSVKNSSKKAIKVTLKKVKGADGYEVRYATKKNMKGAKKVTTKKTTVTIKKLKKGKTYYVQARAYKLDSAGKKVYSAKYSATKKVKIKK